ncbi:MAG: putative glutathione S-transferase [Tardiphaga sp.]|nr:putative glutathione S-transferase [Tardiphaga sp.]MDB5547074.1 putative glutathione S-transferase [Tardiphaga sp.]
MPIPTQITIWGRANSVNVQKVLWCASELDLVFERIDAGMAFGHNDQPHYLQMNPNGRIPTLVEGDFVLWESNAILRYLVLAHGRGSTLYPEAAKIRAGIERWLDWTLSTLQPAERPVFWGLVRTPAAERDMAALQRDTDAVGRLWTMIDAHLVGRDVMEGETFSLADLALGTYARRWFGVEGVVKPELPHLMRWYQRVATRPAFVAIVAPPMS